MREESHVNLLVQSQVKGEPCSHSTQDVQFRLFPSSVSSTTGVATARAQGENILNVASAKGMAMAYLNALP